MNDICNECGKPKATGLSMSAFGKMEEFYSHCHGHAYQPRPITSDELLAAIPPPEPTAPTSVDLTKLIDEMSGLHATRDGFLWVGLRPSARDEIVLALRVLRVLRHPMNDGIGSLSDNVMEILIVPDADRDSCEYGCEGHGLDDAERILGLGGGE